MKKGNTKIVPGVVSIVLSVPGILLLFVAHKNQHLLILWALCFIAIGILLIRLGKRQCESIKTDVNAPNVNMPNTPIADMQPKTQNDITLTSMKQPADKPQARLVVASPAQPANNVSNISQQPDKRDTTAPIEPLVMEQTNEDEQYTVETHHVTGMRNYLDNFRKIATQNYFYNAGKNDLVELDMVNEKIWEYEYSDRNPQLVPEPDNEFDKNAIKVIVDGQHIGYIKKGSCAHLLKVINEGRLISIKCQIGGGRYKYLTLDEDDSYGIDDEDDEETYTLEKDSAPYFVILNIKVAKQTK